jgi:hypothetical protein
MREQKNVYLNQTQRSEIDRLKKKLDEHEKRLKDAFARYKSLNVYKKHLLEHLEFLSGNLPFFEAFTVPPEDEGMKRVGRKGKEMDTFYILDVRKIPLLGSHFAPHFTSEPSSVDLSIES